MTRSVTAPQSRSESRTSFLELPGPPALSGMTRVRLLAELREVDSSVEDVSARFIHYVESSEPLSGQELERLDRLLQYGPARALSGKDAHVVDVVPRIGTISPWSSKATDIARICGLAGIKRIERGIRYFVAKNGEFEVGPLAQIQKRLHDRMTESVLESSGQARELFAERSPGRLATVAVLAGGAAALVEADRNLGLALSPDEIDYLVDSFRNLGRDPTDVELMMFAQANSEHCRHKIFNASWVIDGVDAPHSLFDMIRMTHAAAPDGVLSAYRDNSAVIEGGPGQALAIDPADGTYRYCSEPVHVLMKVETHNHPTAISPFAGAATGSGGEIRDEGATGRGGRPKAGLTGFSVSHLDLPGFRQPWEDSIGRPDRIASALQIMKDGPIGSAAFNNEFGRPNIAGYFRTFESAPQDDRKLARGYHKPIMLAGGMGNVRADDVEKLDVPGGALIVVLGGPAMLIGLGGGAASSMGSGASSEDLDFASVQRDNPEIQRRAQQVIDACINAGRGAGNPIVLIHDVGAGGLSNAVPEVIDHSKLGGTLDMREIPSAEAGMSPLELWCNEAQERYVLAITTDQMPGFVELCERERCPYAVLGETDTTGQLVLSDKLHQNDPVDMPMSVLLGKPPKTVMRVERKPRECPPENLDGIEIEEAARRVLRFPTVADKTFLIHIGDRTVGGLVAGDQFVGPWQVPVADVGVTARDFRGFAGEAMAIGERTPVALLDGPASGRLAVAEAITNIAAADIDALRDIRFSANWMAASGVEGEDETLYDTVKAVGQALCCELGIAIPVGKDSLSLQTRWQEDGQDKAVVAPVSLVVSAFAPVRDIRRTLTPQLHKADSSSLVLIDLGAGKNRLGASCLVQCFDRDGGLPPDLDDSAALKGLFGAVRELARKDLVLAYHDRSDGGLFACICEMSFAGRAGVRLDLEVESRTAILAALFAEEPGVVLQVRDSDMDAVLSCLGEHGLESCAMPVGVVTGGDRVEVCADGQQILDMACVELHETWSEVSLRMQSLRDNPETADQARQALLDVSDPGLSPIVNFDADSNPAAPFIATGARPGIAILREQGVNSHAEMAAAFEQAGFQPVDVHMTDLMAGRRNMSEFVGLAACGGFSYGDVLGAGGGWAKSILFNPRVRDQLEAFFQRPDTFTLGVCNGCQMLAELREIIPGASDWPRFVRNRSDQFEARLSLVEVLESPSILMQDMVGSRLLIATSHGEGRAEFASEADRNQCEQDSQIAIRYVDNSGRPAASYPANPNGSPGGIAGLCSSDGRVTALMPHPERVFRSVQHSWHPPGWGNDGPWSRLFRNARVWVS